MWLDVPYEDLWGYEDSLMVRIYSEAKNRVLKIISGQFILSPIDKTFQLCGDPHAVDK